GITREPPIKLAVRRSRDDYTWRYEYEWPLARTRWTRYYLDAADGSLRTTAPAASAVTEYDATPESTDALASFSTEPVAQDTEITGPLALHASVSAASPDADLFVVIRSIAPDGTNVGFQGTMHARRNLAAAYGWLRLSHRALDVDASTSWRPVHLHTE